jgi:hypothetical protein
MSLCLPSVKARSVEVRDKKNGVSDERKNVELRNDASRNGRRKYYTSYIIIYRYRQGRNK